MGGYPPSIEPSPADFGGTALTGPPDLGFAITAFIIIALVAVVSLTIMSIRERRRWR